VLLLLCLCIAHFTVFIAGSTMASTFYGKTVYVISVGFLLEVAQNGFHDLEGPDWWRVFSQGMWKDAAGLATTAVFDVALVWWLQERLWQWSLFGTLSVLIQALWP